LIRRKAEKKDTLKNAVRSHLLFVFIPLPLPLPPSFLHFLRPAAHLNMRFRLRLCTMYIPILFLMEEKTKWARRSDTGRMSGTLVFPLTSFMIQRARHIDFIWQSTGSNTMPLFPKAVSQTTPFFNAPRHTDGADPSD
jgi:hypothetical protein